ncbi:hypothetical protein [Massilia glaciei]|uniref:hypothetical protein n=1 Tax=Massilia glaciei TaxID=1524097 RepID=UPI0011B264B5|nr:hypothetical protein [Massilia glaciei]
MKPPIPALELQYRRKGDKLPSVGTQFDEMFRFSQTIGSFSPLLQHWYLSSDKSESDALLYEAFDANGPTAAAHAVVSTETQGIHDIRAISAWNGARVKAEGASLSSM